MKPSFEQIETLLALKREVHLEEGYWQDFLCEFHQKQRQQAVSASGISAWFAGVSAWASNLGAAKWAYGAGMAYAAFTAAFLLLPREVVRESQSPIPASYQQVPSLELPVIEQLHELDLSPTTQGNAGEQIF